MKIKTRQIARENKQMSLQNQTEQVQQQRSSEICVFCLVNQNTWANLFLKLGPAGLSRLAVSGVSSAACFHKICRDHNNRGMAGHWGFGTTTSSSASQPGTDWPFSTRLCLLMRSHSLFISMLFFFPISGMNSIKPMLSVFIMCRFAMIVNEWILSWHLSEGTSLFSLLLCIGIGFKYSPYVVASVVFWLCLGSVCFKPQPSCYTSWLWVQSCIPAVAQGGGCEQRSNVLLWIRTLSKLVLKVQVSS